MLAACTLLLLPPTPPRVPPPQVVVVGDPLSFTTIREFGGTSIEIDVFVCVNFVIVFVFQQKCIGTEEGLSKLPVRQEHVKISILWSFAEVILLRFEIEEQTRQLYENVILR